MAKIKLTRGYCVIVDDDDYERLSRFKWYASKDAHGIFAARWRSDSENGILPKNIRIGREILGVLNPFVKVSYLDKDRFNNKKVNLLLCPSQEGVCQHKRGNKEAFSPYKGVCYDNHRAKRRKKWVCSLQYRGQRRRKRYLTELEAATAYDQLAKKYFGKFAFLNFPEREAQ